VQDKYVPAALPRLLYVYALGAAFSIFWGLYRLLIISSPINKYETFLSVLRSDRVA